MASQQKLGLLPEQRIGIGCVDCDHPVALGTHLINNTENVKGKTTKFTGKDAEETKEPDQ